MSHRAALYRVKIREKREAEWLLFGDFDGAGTWLGDVVGEVLGKLDGRSRDRRVIARVEAALPHLEMDQVGFSVTSGRSGVTSVLEKDGVPPYDRTPGHVEAMRSAVLLQLPRGHNVGRLAVHVPHGRSCKGIIENALRSALGGLGYVVELGPIVPASALAEAVERDAVERVTLIKYDPARSDKFADAARWGTDEVERLELSFPSRRRSKLRRDPIRKFLSDPTAANRREIVEFGGLVFDEAEVTVELPDGVRRTFYLEPRDGGHPMTTGMQVSKSDRFGPTGDELSRELRRALADVVGPS